MTVEYLPVGIACNISCKYCYQDPMRDAGNINVPRDWEKVKKQLTALGQDFSIFGGEPLLAPIAHIKEVFEFGFKKFGRNGIQTNGSLITDEHIKLFKAYNVRVGISIDGPGLLNSVRCTNALTKKTERAIRKLCDQGVPPSIICTIHKGNFDSPVLIGWLNDLVSQGVHYINFHEMEVECGKEEWALSEDDNIWMFLELYEWAKTKKVYVNPFVDIKALLTQEHPQVMCVWNHCDPLTTAAVQGVNPDGSRSNCGRASKDGVNWVKADSPGLERYIALYHTPQEFGGCRGCRYFAFCKGHCPGTAIEGDWRNRTQDCRLWYTLFERIEKDNADRILDPLIIKRKELEVINQHGDSPHGDGHGDTPHGDAHGDHWDDGVEATILKESPLNA
jgi:uncharacterized protein